MSTNREVVFAHFQLSAPTVNGQQGTGYVCLALRRPPKGSTATTYDVSLAACTPDDFPNLNRKIARTIAAGRLQSPRPGRHVTLNSNVPSAKIKELMLELLTKASDPSLTVERGSRTIPFAPAWLRRALQTGATFTQV